MPPYLYYTYVGSFSLSFTVGLARPFPFVHLVLLTSWHEDQARLIRFVKK